ncbi:fibronectin type-III domain-containing protein 3a-like isoform X3 [Apteryx rowi]|uniref:fibronectin type-III domain-containing protein 3a-like isoform X3 n=1 Tax=Apteryx rowi TaxID=308060 RepID=UPI000E1C7983|nr:fibronectin type-III domain-containing protein 3a-like isoform X3 [Apteryx rowi]
MMAEHSPLLDTTPIISSEIPLLTSPIVSGDGAQQVILVQVNPGEAFTIRREDGQFQCITGPAQVPMMSPNGSVPTIYVPPGYAPQVIEDSGVRRVVVVPQAPEFHPGGHAVIHRPPHPPLPGFLPLPAMIPPPPRHIYSPVTGAGDMATQYIPQYHTSQVYGDMVLAIICPPEKMELSEVLLEFEDFLILKCLKIKSDILNSFFFIIGLI